jgi:AAA+ superfamily predicted ATPase
VNDPGLVAALDALHVAFGGYLARLRETWAAVPDDGAGSDVARLLAGVGMAPVASDDDRAAFAKAVDAMTTADGRFARLGDVLALDVGERLVVAAAWWADADPQLAVVLGCAHDDGGRRYASASLLRLVLAPFDVAVPPALPPDGALVRGGVVEDGAGPDRPLRLTPTALRVLAGLPPLATPQPSEEPVPRHAEPAERLALRLAADPRAVLLRGPRGAGGHALARAVAALLGRPAVEDARPAPELRLLARLEAALPVVEAARLEELAWAPGDGALLAYGGPADAPYGAHVVELRRPDPAARRAHWTAALRAAGFAEAAAADGAARLGARFAFAEEEIDRAVASAALDAAWAGRTPALDDVWQAARRQPEHELNRVASLVAPAFTLDDLVLPPDVRAQLDEVVAHVALQDVVLDDWGFRRRLPRGQGVAVLFGGPSGTGKTLAAEAVAAALGQDLYRIDLSSVVSKYIGETEKNLAVAFDEAERAAAVLFFDECDSLFGKRTEQHDAHDRWANLEVNYLLQRVETFTGLVILATNRRAALDEAFLRRLRFSIRFELPDAELRRELWRRAFPGAAPTDDLDLDALAAGELAGGPIQQAALSAAFLAAMDGAAVGPAHVDRALRREYEKLGKAWSAR